MSASRENYKSSSEKQKVLLSFGKFEHGGKKSLFLQPQETQQGSIFDTATMMIKLMAQRVLLRPLINFSPYEYQVSCFNNR